MSKYRRPRSPLFRDTDNQVAAVVMEIAQLVLRPFRKTFQRSQLRKIIAVYQLQLLNDPKVLDIMALVYGTLNRLKRVKSSLLIMYV